MKLETKDIQPLGALVLVRVYHERKTSGGLFVPDSAKAYGQNTAEVIAVGPGDLLRDAESGAVHLRRSELEPGDVVLLRYHREEIRLPGQPDADDDSADSHVALVDPSVCIAKLIGWEPGRVAA